MTYSYMPGCAVSAARGYDAITRAVMSELGVPLVELEDWNCCGSTAVDPLSDLLSLALPARNLALAEAAGKDLVTGCGSCFFNLFRVNHRLARDPVLRVKLDEVLLAAGLRYTGKTRVRHLLDILANDIGINTVERKVKRKLAGLKVVPYYGCQIMRPSREYDGTDFSASADQLIEIAGARLLPYSWKTRCCGGSLMTSEPEIGLKLAGDLLAVAGGADCIVTVCPVCQANLEARQRGVPNRSGVRPGIPVLFLTKLLGIAFGIVEDALYGIPAVREEVSTRW